MWVVYILISAVILAFFDISRKAAIRDNAILPVLTISNFVYMVLLAIFFALTGDLGAIVATTTSRELLLIFIKALTIAVEWVATLYAFRTLPISTCVPVYASSPFWVILGAMAVYHESPTGKQAIGMVVILAGYIVFAMAGREKGGDKDGVFIKGILICLLGVIGGAASSVYDKWLVNPEYDTINPEKLQLVFIFFMFVLALFGTIAERIVSKVWAARGDVVKTIPLRMCWAIPAIGFFLVISDWFYFRAAAEPGTLISIVTLLRRLNVVITFVLGLVIFHEKNSMGKILSLLLIIAGAVLLSL